MSSKQQIFMQGIPVTSPYYDRLRSLKIDMDFVPYNAPEYHHLKRQIKELELRARKRMALELFFDGKRNNMNFD